MTPTPAATPAPAPRITRGVSFYSYQEEYFTRAMTMEDCIEEVASMGATGVQLISEQMIPSYPYPSTAWIDSWFALMDCHGTTPTVLDTYWDFNVGGHRSLDLDEALCVLTRQIGLASELGFSVLRPTEGNPQLFKVTDLIERALPIAEKLDIRIAPEIHSPALLSGPKVQSYLETIHRSGTRHFGFTLDMSVFQDRYPRVVRDRQIRDGVLREAVAVAITDTHEAGTPRDEALAAAKAMGASDAELRFFNAVHAIAFEQNVADLTDFLPHVMNVHAKILEMTEDMTEYSIPYEKVIPALVAGGYKGSIDTEYEGQRHTQDALQTDSCEQVRRNQLQLRRMLGEIPADRNAQATRPAACGAA
ncbi:hypothetical protein H7F51_14390 [Novosphingobium flavum]|uniref:Xylose isomerase-like TIM barrel domain-containing protein n=1 Tax=Novosphingobium flavum TaxID=1778672 RepID=A0A7X1FUL6_9SPHN|nr:TIM barrel protein [Novosphingobium flavum]MBC2666707.1 hypothetical protein [Novosphingobium flavum]